MFLVPTEFIQAPKDVVLSPNSIITFPCKVKSDPGTLLTIKWLRAGEPIAVFEKDRIYVNDENSLIINATSEIDGGNSFVTIYTCVATNGVKTISANATLKPEKHLIEKAPILTTKASYTGQHTSKSLDKIDFIIYHKIHSQLEMAHVENKLSSTSPYFRFALDRTYLWSRSDGAVVPLVAHSSQEKAGSASKSPSWKRH